MKNKGNINVVIWRPTIITSAYKQPFKGWTDSASAAGGLSLLTGLGILKEVHGDGLATFDIVPVDYCSNGLLVATAHADMYKNFAAIYNCSSSLSNPIDLKTYRDIGVTVFKRIKLYDAIDKAKVDFVPNAI